MIKEKACSPETFVNGPDPGTGNIELSWLGQAGFVFRYGDRILLIDPYLSDFAEQWTFGRTNEHIRMTAAPVQAKELYVTQLEN